MEIRLITKHKGGTTGVCINTEVQLAMIMKWHWE